MNEKEIVRDVMKHYGITQSELAKRMGYKYPSSVSEAINRQAMSVDIFWRMVDAMDCEVIIKCPDKEWVLDRSN